MNISVMTYNICSGRNLAREMNLNHAASVIRALKADIVALNEVRSHTHDSGPVNQAWELGRLTGYYPVFGKSIDVAGGEYGNALLTRLPLTDWEVIHIPDPVDDPEPHKEHRTILRCRLLAGDAPLTMLVSHFGLTTKEQISAVNTALEALKEETGPVIMAGDFNMPPDHPTLSPLMEALRDTADPKTSLFTFPSDLPTGKIDYILFGGSIRALSLESMDTQCSDHRPLIAAFVLD